MKLFSEDIEFIKELYLKKQLEIYYFHEKYLLSPAQLARTINKFTSEKIIIMNDDIITLTPKGDKWIFANRKKLFLYTKPGYWKEIPKYMKEEKVEINKPFKTSFISYDNEIFKLLEDEDKN